MNKVEYTPAAIKGLQKLHPNVRARILAKIQTYAETGSGDITSLKGIDGFRLRVGDWRVLFIDGKPGIVVWAIGHRREIYL